MKFGVWGGGLGQSGVEFLGGLGVWESWGLKIGALRGWGLGYKKSKAERAERLTGAPRRAVPGALICTAGASRRLKPFYSFAFVSN